MATIYITDTNITQWNGIATDGSPIVVECIGAGAGGALGNSAWVGAGAGEYRASTVAYVSGSIVTGVKIGKGGVGASSNSIGTDGEDTYWNTSVIIAKGGLASRQGGTGGTGTVGHKGGDGSAGSPGNVASGGSAGASSSDGNPGSLADPVVSIGGARINADSGNGGNGHLAPDASCQGGSYGGAGGNVLSGPGSAGNGANGVIKITYTPATPPPPKKGVHYAIQIFSTASDAWNTLTDATVGLYSGVFQVITDRPHYDGSTVIPTFGPNEINIDGSSIAGQTIVTPWKEGMLQKESITENPSRDIDIVVSGTYATDATFSFKIRNDQKFWNYCNVHNISFTGRRIVLWVVIDDVFYLGARGRVTNNPYTETDYSFDIEDDATLIHKIMPPLVATSTNQVLAPDSQTGQPIPSVFGDVPFSKILKLTQENTFFELQNNALNASIAAAGKYTILSSTPTDTLAKIYLRTDLMTFVADDLKGKYLIVQSGENANTTMIYKITKSDATSYTDIVNFNGHYMTVVYIESLLLKNDNTIVSEAEFNSDDSNDRYSYFLQPSTTPTHGSVKTWWFKISDFSLQTQVSTNLITLPTNSNGLISLWTWDATLKQYVDISSLVSITSNGNSIILLANTATSDGKAMKIEDIGLPIQEFGVRTQPPHQNGVNTRLEFYQDAATIALLTDRSRLTSFTFLSQFGGGADALADYLLYARFKLTPIIPTYDRIFFLVDMSLRNLSPQTSKHGHFMYSLVDEYGQILSISPGYDTAISPKGYGTSLLLVDSTLRTFNFIPNDFYPPANIASNPFSMFGVDSGNGSDTWGNLCDFANMSAPQGIDDLKREDCGSIECMIDIHADIGNWAGLYITLRQITLLGMRQVDTINGDIFAKVEGEKTGATATDPNHFTNDVYHTFMHILEDYDGIPKALIDYGNLASTRSGPTQSTYPWHVGRTITERKNSIEYLTELCAHAFVGMFTTRTGKRGLRAFQTFGSNPTPTFLHNSGNIVRDSLTDFTKTDISQLFNSFFLQYNFDAGLQEFTRAFFVANLDMFSSFPPVENVTISPNYQTTSSTSMFLSLGLKTLTVDANLPYSNGQTLYITPFVGASPYMQGVITSYNSTTGSLTVNIQSYYTTGLTYNSWVVGSIQDPEWFLCFGGLVGSPNFAAAGYAESKVLWDKCEHSYTVNSVVKQAGNDISQLMWFIDRALFDSSTTWGTSDTSSAYYLLQLLAQWATLQKYIATYSIPINAANIELELLDAGTLNDPVFTNGVDKLGYIVSIAVNSSNDQLDIKMLLLPDELQPYPPQPVAGNMRRLISPLGVPFTQGKTS
jgi:hypothetical protein